MSRRDRRQNNPTGFWVVYRGQAEPSVSGETCAGQSCHGLCWSSFRRVGCFFTARRGAPSSSACRLRGPQFAAALFPWAAIRSWVLRATKVQETCTRSIHAASRALRVFLEPGPARVSKFGGDIPAVAGPSASWGDLRLVDPTDSKQSLRSIEDVLAFRTDFLSEVSHRPV